MRNKGIITILVGIGILFISIFFSSGSHPKLDLMGNISRMEIVLEKGEYVSGTGLFSIGHYEGRVAIPLKYPLSLSALLILIGTGIVSLSKNKGTSVQLPFDSGLGLFPSEKKSEGNNAQ